MSAIETTDKLVGPEIMYALTGHTEISQAQFDFHAQYVPQTVAFYRDVVHSSDPALGPFESLGLSLWQDPNFQAHFANLTQSEFLQEAYTIVFGSLVGAQYAHVDEYGLVQAIQNWQNLYNTVPQAYANPHQAALATAFGDLVGIGNEVVPFNVRFSGTDHSLLHGEAVDYVSLLLVGQAPYNADLSHYAPIFGFN
jgi:hypothetical protein